MLQDDDHYSDELKNLISTTGDSFYKRVFRALQIAEEYGSYDGGHHKMWVIDQMVRALTGCPNQNILFDPQQDSVYDCGDGRRYYLPRKQGESKAYKEFVREICSGERGTDTYVWDTGIAP